MGALMCAGGAMAFFRKGSKMSLIGGCGTGALYIGSGLLIQSGQNRNGHALALGTSLVLAGGMGARAAKTSKFMPAGLVATLGGLCGLYQAKKVLGGGRSDHRWCSSCSRADQCQPPTASCVLAGPAAHHSGEAAYHEPAVRGAALPVIMVVSDKLRNLSTRSSIKVTLTRKPKLESAACSATARFDSVIVV
eukprot:CAMPEP_0202809010 /NCGR_PEP_ID=MMETSP1389-20130828/1428_1 /ASSEMBLY_ACC=CAM_ASM_000865 /TAXON_ID=302021 /ORGANISM="Rhodomonas sp., Strain CCMP768" /LENGTH=191 /DNA_ID=CAMNT_0049479507 /DNA_START=74 /DNA_END=647 /DNA_ORIENTATION=+